MQLLWQKSYLDIACNQKKENSSQQIGKFRANGEQRNYRVHFLDQEGQLDNENLMVLNVEEEEENTKPYYVQGFINGTKFQINFSAIQCLCSR